MILQPETIFVFLLGLWHATNISSILSIKQDKELLSGQTLEKCSGSANVHEHKWAFSLFVYFTVSTATHLAPFNNSGFPTWQDCTPNP